MSGISKTKYTSQAIANMGFDDGLKVPVTELIDSSGNLMHSIPDKIPTYDLYISYNVDGTTNQKIWKIAGTSTVVKTLTYGYTGGVLTSKLLS